MWLTFEFGDIQLRWIESLGRATVVCQSFDQNLRWIASMLCSIGDYRRRGLELDESVIDRFGELMDLIRKRGGAVEHLNKLSTIGVSNIQLLKEARSSRNYFAHKASSPCHSSATELIKAIPEFRSHLANVARGDDLISRWCYEFTEKEPAPRQDHYIDQVMFWVLAPLRVLSEESAWQIVLEKCESAMSQSTRISAHFLSELCQCNNSAHHEYHEGRCQARATCLHALASRRRCW